MQKKLNPHEHLIGKEFRSRQSGDTGKVTEVKRQPRSLVFMKMGKYRKEYHVLLDMTDGNTLAGKIGYPVPLFKEFFKEL